jgi:hypothetical protein
MKKTGLLLLGLLIVLILSLSAVRYVGFAIIPTKSSVTIVGSPPNITSYYPLVFNFTVDGTDTLYFNISFEDPDGGPISQVYWSMDDVVEKQEAGSLTSEFSYTFGCGVEGWHKVTAEVTDGISTDSVDWVFFVNYKKCPGGGGGGGGSVSCTENWTCTEWENCKKLPKDSEELPTSLNPLWDELKFKCESFSWAIDENCGYQTRECTDQNHCNDNATRPKIIRECFYTIHPNCADNIQNCHDGKCEEGVDCGGTCPPCPSCLDNIQNCHHGKCEEGVDCGGPCSSCVTEEIPGPASWINKLVRYVSIAILAISVPILILAIIIYFLRMGWPRIREKSGIER